MKYARKPGSTSNIFQVFIRDSSSTTGAGLTGLTNASSGLTAYYHRDTDTTATAISLVTMTVGTFTSSGFKEIDSTNMPGWYQFCPPDAAMAAGAKSVALHLKGVTNMAPLPIEIDLDAQVDVTSWLGTAVTAATAGIPDVNTKNINNVAAATPGASGGVLIAGSNAATTFSGLTTGALACTTITASGAVAFQSTFAVTTSTALGAVSGSTLTLSGAVALQSTFTVTGVSTLTAGLDVGALGSNLPALRLAGNGSGPGLSVTGGATGAGLSIVGGGTSGAGITITTTSGDGFSVTPTAGNAIVATANGTSKHGLVVTGGTAGTSDGLKAVAGTGGVSIRGSLSGSVGDLLAINGSTPAAANLSAAYAALETGTAQGGGASTITLRSGASATNDFYKSQAVFVLSGTGAGQTNNITAYVGSTKVATVETAWATQPDNTSVYVVIGRIG